MTPMRELVYVSNHKLNQFLPDPKRRWRKFGRLRIGIRTPIGSASLEPLPSDLIEAQSERLQGAIQHIESKAQWYESTQIVPGQWIFFDALLKLGVYGVSKAIALFVDARTYSQGTRLLLHGSPKHLVVYAEPSPKLEATVEVGDPSDSYYFIDMVPKLPALIGPL